MITIRSWRDLEQFGIVPLTGEACSLTMRLLCDLTPRGRRIVEAVFSLNDMKVTFTPPPAWNGSVCRLVGGDPPEESAAHSIMLPYDILGSLAVFCLVDVGCSEIYMAEGKPTIGMKPQAFLDLKHEHGEFAELRHRLNLKFIYGGEPMGDMSSSGDDFALCCRVIKVPNREGSLLLRTREQHQMSERTV